MNIQPIRRFGPDQEPRDVEIIPEIVDLQMRAMYELGFDTVRVTLGFADLGLNLLGAVPYVRAARALGIDVLGIVGQFGYFHDLSNVLVDPQRRPRVLDGYLELYAGPVATASPEIERAGDVSFQILNEPANFLGVPPTEYVRSFLAPSYEHLKAKAPRMTVVSAAPVGEPSGIRRVFEMIGAGVEEFCDVVGLHVYEPGVLERLAGITSKPVWITETGALGPGNHLPWIQQVYPEIRRHLPTTEKIFFFELFDLSPNAFRILDISDRDGSGLTSVPESVVLYEDLLNRVVDASGSQPRATYDELIPDITNYFPTEEDVELILELVET